MAEPSQERKEEIMGQELTPIEEFRPRGPVRPERGMAEEELREEVEKIRKKPGTVYTPKKREPEKPKREPKKPKEAKKPKEPPRPGTEMLESRPPTERPRRIPRAELAKVPAAERGGYAKYRYQHPEMPSDFARRAYRYKRGTLEEEEFRELEKEAKDVMSWESYKVYKKFREEGFSALTTEDYGEFTQATGSKMTLDRFEKLIKTEKFMEEFEEEGWEEISLELKEFAKGEGLVEFKEVETKTGEREPEVSGFVERITDPLQRLVMATSIPFAGVTTRDVSQEKAEQMTAELEKGLGFSPIEKPLEGMVGSAEAWARGPTPDFPSIVMGYGRKIPGVERVIGEISKVPVVGGVTEFIPSQRQAEREWEFMREHPGYAVGSIGGEFGQLIAFSELLKLGKKGFTRASEKALSAYDESLRRALGREAVEELAERPGRVGRFLKKISPKWAEARAPRRYGRITKLVSGVSEPEEIGEAGLRTRLRTGVGKVEELYKPGEKIYVPQTEIKRFAGARGPAGGRGIVEQFSGKKILSLLEPEEAGRVSLIISEAGEKMGRRAGYKMFIEPEILGGRGVSQMMKGLGETVFKAPKPLFKPAARRGLGPIGRGIIGAGVKAIPKPKVGEELRKKERGKRVPRPKLRGEMKEFEADMMIPRPVVREAPKEREKVKEVTALEAPEVTRTTAPEPTFPEMPSVTVPFPTVPFFEEEKKEKKRKPREFMVEELGRKREFDLGSMLRGLEDYEI